MAFLNNIIFTVHLAAIYKKKKPDTKHPFFHHRKKPQRKIRVKRFLTVSAVEVLVKLGRAKLGKIGKIRKAARMV